MTMSEMLVAVGISGIVFIAVAIVLFHSGRSFIALVNYAQYREADGEAARAASLRVLDEWQPSPPFFLMIVAP